MKKQKSCLKLHAENILSLMIKSKVCMENYLQDVFERKKEQIEKFVLSVYDNSGELFSEMKNEVFFDFRKQEITNVAALDEFLLQEVDILIAKGDDLFFNIDYKNAILAYLKAFLFTYFVDAKTRAPGYLFEAAAYIFCQLAKSFYLVKVTDEEFYNSYSAVFDGYDAEYGALSNAAYFAWHFLGISGVDGVNKILDTIKVEEFDYSGAFKMGLLMYIRLNIVNHNFDLAVAALDCCDYKLINDNMYMGTGINRISERFLVLFVNVLILNNRQEFVRKILEKNSLIRDCYEILLLNYHQNKQ